MSTQTPPSASPRSEDEIDLLEVFRIFWRRRLLVLTLTVLPMLLATAFVLTRPKSYVAEATLLPASQHSDSVDLMAAGLAAHLGPVAAELGGFGVKRTPGIPELLNSRGLAARVVVKCSKELNLPAGVAAAEATDHVKDMVLVSQIPNSRALSVQVKAPTPDLAAKLANAYVESLQEALNEYAVGAAMATREVIDRHMDATRQALAEDFRRLSQVRQQRGEEDAARLQQEVEARRALYHTLFQQREAAIIAQKKPPAGFVLLDSATPPSKPRTSKHLLLIPLAAFVGLTFGMLGAFVCERLDAERV